MLLVYVTALLAVCGAERLDRKYLPPITAKIAGGSPNSVLPPPEKSTLPIGSYVNDDQGVVVNAVAAGTRSSGTEPTGLGGPRPSYGSNNSKVGDAAFEANIATRIAPGFNIAVVRKDVDDESNFRRLPGIIAPVISKVSGNNKYHASTLKFSNEINKEKYSYGFETDNGIAVGEKGVAGDGIRAHGVYSYKSDDGNVYSVSYTADKDGYKPKGNHLPTPPPIPDEIVKSLEDNAKDEAAGIVDDGSYDAQKYNNEGNPSSDNYDHINNKSSVREDTVTSSLKSQSVVEPSKQTHVDGFHGSTGSISQSFPENIVHSFGKQNTDFSAKKQSGFQTEQATFSNTGYFGTKPNFGTLSNNYQARERVESSSPFATANQFDVVTDKSSTFNFGDSSATAVASTGDKISNKELSGVRNYFGRIPPSSVSNNAYSSATAITSDNASASASTNSNNPINGANLHEYGTVKQFLQDSKFVKANKDITQASISSFPSILSTPTSQFKSHSNQFNSKHTPQYSQSTAGQSQHGFTGSTQIFNEKTASQFGHKPFATFSHTDNSKVQEGTLYEYNKPSSYKDITSAFGYDTSSLNEQQINLLHSEINFNGTHMDTKLSKPFAGTTQTGPSSFQFQLESSSSKKDIPQKTSTIQQNQGALYEYNKPANNISSDKKSSEETSPLQPKFDLSKLQNTGLASNIPTQSTFSVALKGTDSAQKNIGSTVVEKNTHTADIKKLFDHTTGNVQTPQKSIPGVSQFGQTTGIQGQVALGTKDFSKVSQTDFGSIFGPQFERKPNVETNVSLAPNVQQVSQFSNKPFETASVQSAQQTTAFGQQHFSSSKNADRIFSQNVFGSTIKSQFGQKPQSNAAISVSTNPEVQQAFQFTTKPLGSQSTYGKSKTTQKRISSISQFGQTTDAKGQSTQQTTSLGSQPFGSIQTTGTGLTQTAFSSTSGSQYGQKPQSNVGTSLSVTPQLPIVSQFGTKPFGSQFATGTIQTTQKGKSEVSQFGQTTAGIKGQTEQQTTDFGKQPFVTSQTTDTSFSQTTFSSNSGSQYGQKPQSNVGTSVGTSSQVPIVSQFGSKPFAPQSAIGTVQATQKGKSEVFQFGQTIAGIKGQTEQKTTGFGKQPFGSSQTTGTSLTQAAFSSTSTSQYGQKPQSNVGTGVGTSSQVPIVSQFGTKPFGSQSNTGTVQTTQKDKSEASQFGQTTGINGQIAQQTTGFGKQPFGSSQSTGSRFTQSSLSSTSGTQYGQKPQSNLGTTHGATSQVPIVSQFGTKPCGLQSATGTVQRTQKYKSEVSQFDQTTGNKGQIVEQTIGFGKQPFGSSQSTGSRFTPSSFSSTSGTQYGQKPQSNVGTSLGATPQVPIVSQFGTKPFGSQFATGTIQTTQKGKSEVSQFGQTTAGIKGQTEQQTTGFGKQPFGSSQTTGTSLTQTAFSSTSASQYGQKPQSNVGTGVGTSSQVPIVSQFGNKPFALQSAIGTVQATQKGKSEVSQFGQTTAGIKGQTEQKTTGFGKQPFGSSQTTGTSLTQAAFSSTSASQYGQKPQSNVGTGVGTSSQVPIVSQFGTKPFGSQSNTGTVQTTQKDKSEASQFGQTTGINGQIAQQTTGFGKQRFGSSQSTGSRFTQSSLSSTSGMQYGQRPQSNFGTSHGATSQVPIVSQFGTKPFGSQSTTGTVQTTQKDKSEASQFGQTTGINGQIAQQTTGFGKQPFGSSQSTGSRFTQSSLSSTSGTQYGQKPQSNVRTSLGATPQVPIVSQFGTKPFGSQFATGTIQTTQKGKSEVSQFGQTTAGIKNQTEQQTTGFGKQPFGSSQTTGTSLTQTAFSSTSASQYGQKPQSHVGIGVGTSSQVPIVSQFGTKPFGSQSTTGTVQTTQKDKSEASQFGQTTGINGQIAQQTTGFGKQPFGSSQTTGSRFTQSSLSSTSGTQYGQKPQSNLGTSHGATSQVPIVSQFGTKPFGSQFATGTIQTTQKGKSEVSQFGQTTAGIKGQTEQQTTGFSKQSFGSSQTIGTSLTQAAFSSTSASQYGEKPQYNVGTGVGTSQVPIVSQFGTKPFGSQSTTGTVQTTQKDKSEASQFGQTTGINGQIAQQTTGFGKQPFGSSQSTGSRFTQSSLSSTSGTQYGQKPQSNLGTSHGATSQVPIVSQFGTKPFGSQFATGTIQTTQKGKSEVSLFGQTTAGIKGQTEQQTTGFSKQPFGSSQTTGTSLTQTAFSSTSASQYRQKPQSNVGTGVGTSSQVPIVSQFGNKPFAPQSAIGTVQATQKGKSEVSQFGQTTAGIKDQTEQKTTGFGKQPFGSSQTTGTSLTQAAFSSTSASQYGQKPQSNVGTGVGTSSQVPIVSQFGTKPFGSQFATGTIQTTQKGKSEVSQFGQTTAGIKGQTEQQTTGFSKQPFGSSQTTGTSLTQTAFSSTSASQYGQKPQSNVGTGVGTSSQVPIVSQFGNKPFAPQSAIGTVQATQKGKSEVSQFGQTTAGIKGQTEQKTTGFGKQPFGSSQTTGTSLTQAAFSSTSASQYGQKPQSNVGTGVGTSSQVPIVSQFSTKPFGSQSTTGTVQTTQKDKLETSQFGQTAGNNGQIAQQTTGFGKQPFGSSQSTGSRFTQSSFSSKSGTQYGQKPQSNLGTSLGGTPQVPIVFQFGRKPFAPQSATGTVQKTQEGKSEVSQFGQTASIKGQTEQQTTGFGKQPFSSSQTTGTSLTQAAISSTSASQYGQKPQSNVGTGVGTSPQVPIVSQFGSKAFRSQPNTGTVQTTQKDKSEASQFGQTTGINGQIAQQTTGFGKQPYGSSQSTGSRFTQTSLSSTSGTQYGQKSQSNMGTSLGATPQVPIVSQFGTKPFGSQFDTGTIQTTQKGKSEVSQFGKTIAGIKGQTEHQTTGFGKQPLQPQFYLGTSHGATPQDPIVSQFGTKPFGSQFATETIQTTQKGKSEVFQFGQTTAGIKGQTEQQTTGFSKRPFGSSQTTGTSLTQATFSSTSASQYGQKPQSNVGTGVGTSSQVPIVSQFGTKPFGSQSNTGTVQTTQKDKSEASQFGQTTGINGQIAQQTTGFGKQPFGSSQSTGSRFTQSSFSSTSGTQYGQKLQSNLGTSVGDTPQVPIVSQFGTNPFEVVTKPFGSQTATGLTESKTGQNKESKFDQSHFSKKLVLNSQAVDSDFEKKSSSPEVNQTPNSTSNSQISSSFQIQFEKEKQPFVNTQAPFLSRFDFTNGQPQNSVSAFASNSGSLQKIGTEYLIPVDTGFTTQKASVKFVDESKSFRTPSTLSTFVQGQGSSHFRDQPTQFKKYQIVPATQISVDQLRSTTSTSNSAVYPSTATFAQKSSQFSGSLVSDQPLKSKERNFGIESIQESSKLGTSVSSDKSLTSSVNNDGQSYTAYLGRKEVFEAFRHPPKFDVKTGYHY